MSILRHRKKEQIINVYNNLSIPSHVIFNSKNGKYSNYGINRQFFQLWPIHLIDYFAVIKNNDSKILMYMTYKHSDPKEKEKLYSNIVKYTLKHTFEQKKDQRNIFHNRKLTVV